MQEKKSGLTYERKEAFKRIKEGVSEDVVGDFNLAVVHNPTVIKQL